MNQKAGFNTANNSLAQAAGDAVTHDDKALNDKAMSDGTLNDCGCCEELELRYPKHFNPPGQPALDYRLAVHSGFFERMLAGLSRDQLPGTGVSDERPMAALGTRDVDDPSVALLDAWAMVADVLTFYQERIANEGFIRTAVERRSVLELARAIGYELNPGVAAGTHLAFVAEDSAGAPEVANVHAGTSVLSIPDEESVPQTFETLEAITARAAWNALRPYTPMENAVETVRDGQTTLRLAGLGTGLQTGDMILILGDLSQEQWSLRTVNRIETNAAEGYTQVFWHQTVAGDYAPAQLEVHALRLRTALFGHNAADWSSLSNEIKAEYTGDYIGTNQSLAVSPDGSSIVATDQDGALIIWQRNNGEWTVQQILPHVDVNSLSAVALSASVDRILLGYDDGNLTKVTKDINGVWDSTETPVNSAGDAHPGPIVDLGFSISNDDLAVSHSGDETASINKLWDLTDTSQPDQQLNSWLEANSGGNYYRIGSEAQVLNLWFRSGSSAWQSEQVSAEAHGGGITALGMRLVQNVVFLVSGGADGRVKIWNKTGGGIWWSTVFQLAASQQAGQVVDVALSEDASHVLGRFADGRSRIWRVSDQALRLTFVEQTLGYLPEWPGFALSAVEPQIELDNVYSTITPDSWIALTDPQHEQIYRVKDNTPVWHSEFNLSAKVSRLQLDRATGLAQFSRRDTSVLAQSEALTLYRTTIPITLPIEGDTIELDSFQPKLEAGRSIIVSGRPMRVNVLVDGLELVSPDGFTRKTLSEHDVLTTLARPTTPVEGECLRGWRWDAALQGFLPEVGRVDDGECYPMSPGSAKVTLNWQLRDRNGFIGSPCVPQSNNGSTCSPGIPHDALLLIDPEQPDIQTLQKNPRAGLISEVLLIERVDEVRHDDLGLINSRLTLEVGLRNIFDHNSVEMNANTARASHGETIADEVLGSGDGASANQRFQLNNSPLTYVSAATPSGGKSTLEVRVNGILWQEVESLYGVDGRDQVYMIRHDNEGNTFVIFGDGINGARLPSGEENVRARYRKGVGLEGEVAMDRLKLMQSKPLGIREVNNYLPASGAAAPETFDQARANAPLKVLTLERIVSIQDYQDFTAAFSGVGKAMAAEIWNGQRFFVHITIAGANGGTVLETSELYRNLAQAVDQARDTTVPVRIDTFEPLYFEIDAKLRIDSRYRREDVEADVVAALQTSFDFAHRSFGQAVTAAEVVAVVQHVAGVVAVDLSELRYVDKVTPPNAKRLKAERARWGGTAVLLAQLLLINPSADGVKLGEMAP